MILKKRNEINLNSFERLFKKHIETSVQNLLLNKMNVIGLEQENISIEEVIIRNADPKQILLNAILNHVRADLNFKVRKKRSPFTSRYYTSFESIVFNYKTKKHQPI